MGHSSTLTLGLALWLTPPFKRIYIFIVCVHVHECVHIPVRALDLSLKLQVIISYVARVLRTVPSESLTAEASPYPTALILL